MISSDIIKIKFDKTCKICLSNSIDYQFCKNTKCKVIICNKCLIKLKKEKCPYCTLDNCFFIDENDIDNDSSEDSISSFESEENYSYTTEININRIEYRCYILGIIYYTLIHFIIFLYLMFFSIIIYYGINYICFINNNYLCSLCIPIAIFDILYFIFLNIIYLIKNIRFLVFLKLMFINIQINIIYFIFLNNCIFSLFHFIFLLLILFFINFKIFMEE